MASKAERRLSAWELARELDMVAMPLVEEYGVERAYAMAALELKVSSRDRDRALSAMRTPEVKLG